MNAKDTVLELIAPPGFNDGKDIPAAYYDCTGQQITQEEYQSVAAEYGKKLAVAGGMAYSEADSSDSRWAFLRNNGDGTAALWKMDAPEGLCVSHDFREGLLVVENEAGLKGAVDTSGNLVIECEYSLLYDSSGGFLAGRHKDQSAVEFSVINNPIYPSVKVRGEEAERPGSNFSTVFSVSQLMSAENFPKAQEIEITAGKNSVSAPVSSDGGRTWSFSAVDGAGMSVTYLIEMTEVIEQLSLDALSITMEIGNTHQLNAAVTPERFSGEIFSWSSSDNNVAFVSEQGQVTAAREGKAVVTVVCHNLSASCEVRNCRKDPCRLCRIFLQFLSLEL